MKEKGTVDIKFTNKSSDQMVAKMEAKRKPLYHLRDTSKDRNKVDNVEVAKKPARDLSGKPKFFISTLTTL